MADYDMLDVFDQDLDQLDKQEEKEESERVAEEEPAA